MKRVAWLLGFAFFVLMAAHFELGLFPGLLGTRLPQQEAGLNGLVTVDLLVRGDDTGRIDAHYQKRYPLPGPYEDLLSLPAHNDWFDYPRVEVETTGRVTARVDRGVVDVQGDGPGTVTLRITDLYGYAPGDYHAWSLFAVNNMPGLGAQVVNASVHLPTGARLVKGETGIELGGRQQGLVEAQRFGNMWTVHTGRVEAGTAALFKLSYRNPWVMPGWLGLLSLGIALVAAVLAYRAYRRTHPTQRTE